MHRHFDRRSLFRSAGGLVLLGGLLPQRLLAAPLGQNPFTLGVAAGDPWPDGFVIWTRLAPRPFDEHGGMPAAPVPVRWDVAEDDGFVRVVQSGETLARPELGHSVHVELRGLRPHRHYWYRFMVAGSDSSPIGMARTAPAAGAVVDRVRIGVAGCQHWEAGFFDAWRHIAGEPDLDLIFHYGDYIYEGPRLPLGERIVRQHIGDEIYSLDDYRRRYAQYKSDPHLQAAHAASAFAATFDDHEVDNDWAADKDQDGTPPEYFHLRRLMALQAWYEHMPVRRAQLPGLHGIIAHRRLDYGRLLRLHLLDTRQYRTKQRCGLDGGEHCRPVEDGGGSQMLGAAQEAWLDEGLGGEAGWNLLAQQVMLMPFRYLESRAQGRYNLDSWSGYPDARSRLTQLMQKNNLTNVVVASGDVHKHHVGLVPMREHDLEGPAAATEYVSSSISSGGDGSDIPPGWEDILGENPHSNLVNDRRGYQLFTIAPGQWRTDVIGLDRVSVRGGNKHQVAAFVTLPHQPGAHPA